MTWMSILWVLPALVVLATAALAADKPSTGGTSASAPAGASDMPQRAAALAKEILKGRKTQFGISAIDLADGRKLLAIGDRQMLAPASNQKLVTSAVALATLGGQYKFATRVYLCGKDIAVVGDCDPTLGDPYIASQDNRDIYADLDKWASAIKEKVGDKIDGDLVMYAPAAPGGYRHKDWPRGQADNWYAAPVTTLNFHDNCLDVTFQKVDGKLTPVVSPYTRFIDVVNNLKLGSSHRWSLKTTLNDSVATFTGTMSQPGDDPVSVAIDNPPLFLGRVLAERLLKAGLQIGGDLLLVDARGFDPAKAQEICRTETPLAAVMARANKRSLNMAAEGMFLRACGDWDNGPKLAQDVLAKSYELSEGVKIADGCGLSKYNRICPDAMTRLLAAVTKRPDAQVLLDSLPVSGVDGTMERRLTEAAYKGRVLGKTGWIAGASALSGYVLGPDKKPAIAFSIMVNGVPGPADAKRLEDSICKLLVDSIK